MSLISVPVFRCDGAQCARNQFDVVGTDTPEPEPASPWYTLRQGGQEHHFCSLTCRVSASTATPPASGGVAVDAGADASASATA